MTLTTHLHLVQGLGLNGAVLLFPLRAFVAWAGTTLPLFLLACAICLAYCVTFKRCELALWTGTSKLTLLYEIDLATSGTTVIIEGTLSKHTLHHIFTRHIL